MMIKSLRLKNVRSYTDEAVSFPAGSTLLSGDIGSGKSTILMAMDFALFGLRKGEITGADILRHGADSGSVELRLEIDGKDVEIKRMLKRGNSISHDSCVLAINGLSEALTPTELKARMLEMLGYPQELLKKNKPIFRYTVYTPQEEMKRILGEEDSRLDTLRKIFSIDKYGTIRSNARMFLTELRGMRRELEAYSKDLEAIRAAREENARELAGVLSGIRRAGSALQEHEERHEKKKWEIEKLRSRMDEYRKLQLAAAKTESELGMLERKLQDTAAELANIESKIQFNANIFLDAAEGSAEDAAAAIKILEADRDAMIKNIAVVDAETDRLSGIFSRGVCSFCGQPVSDPESFGRQIDDRKGRRREILEGIRQADEKLSGLKSRKTALEKQNAIRRTIDDLKRWKADKEADMERTNALLSAARARHLSLGAEAEKYRSLEADYAAAESEIAAIEKARLEAEKALSRLEQQREDMEKSAAALEKEALEKEAAREKAGKIGGMISWFDNFILLMENIEKHVLLTVQKEFDQYFQHWFSIIMGDALSVRIDDQFAPVIEQNGYETSFANLSGGEKTAVSLAYRLGLNKVINIMIDSIRTKDLLILDEPTDGFSTDQLDRVRDVIGALGLGQVIIVSHEPKIDTYVENVIKVYKENHVSRVAA